MSPIRPLERLEAFLNVSAPGGDEDPDLAGRFVAVLADHGDPHVALTADEAGDLHAAVERLRGILLISDPDAVADAVNVIFDEVGARPRLSRHDGSPWHVHVDPPGSGWGEWLLASSALALAGVIQDRGRPTWGRCEADGCMRFYIGDGRGAPRRFCSSRCASRVRVARHRAGGRRRS